MKHRRMAWTACVVGITTLGLSGVLSQGCGGDDTSAGPTGTAGSGGSAGGGSGGKGTGGGTAGVGTAGGGAGGGAGGAKVDGGQSDAPDSSQAMCAAGADSGSSCVDTCVCTNCASQA